MNKPLVDDIVLIAPKRIELRSRELVSHLAGCRAGAARIGFIFLRGFHVYIVVTVLCAYFVYKSVVGRPSNNEQSSGRYAFYSGATIMNEEANAQSTS